MDNIYCINLKHRTDKLEALKANIKKFNIDCKLNVVEAIEKKDGRLGCGLSHLKIINMAKQNNWDKVIVIEDDCEFNENSNEIFNRSMKDLPGDCDIFLGGAHKIRIVQKINSTNLFELKKFKGTHFIMYNRSVYDKVLEYKQGDIDRFLSVIINKKNIKIYTCNPMIAVQADGVSDISHKYMNFTNKFNSCIKYMNTYVDK